MVGLCRDLGLKVSRRINTDSTAAKSIGSRRELGRSDIWMFGSSGSRRVSRGDVVLHKVPAAENLADIVTINRSRLDKRLVGMGIAQAPGRHPLNPNQ